jgi:uncharacterized hydrophobic protein (TIGR00341 family)
MQILIIPARTKGGEMKKVLITIRSEEFENLKPEIDQYLYTEGESRGVKEIRIYLPDAELDDFINRIRDAIDLNKKENIIEATSPALVISPFLEKIEKDTKKDQRSPIEMLVESANENIQFDTAKIALTSIAGLVALTGLFLDSTAIIIGAMLLSPILAPISAFAILAAAGRLQDAMKSLALLGVLLASVVLVSFFATVLIYIVLAPPITEEISVRAAANPIYILMAALLGAATILALEKGVLEVIAGIAVAVALVPPTVVIGIYLVADQFLAVRSLLLVLQNVIGLILGSVITAAVLQIRPRSTGERALAKKTLIRIALILILSAALLIAISNLLA